MKTEIFRRETLKDRMRKELIEVLANRHDHQDINAFFQCKSCYEKVEEWKAKRAKMGLADPRNYLGWNRIKK